jgi:hypothetical protein
VTSGPGVTASPSAGDSSGGVASLPPGSAGSPGESTSPNESASPGPTGAPVESEATSPSEAPSASAGPADACTASDANRAELFVPVANAVEWPVLCAVLPGKWHLSHGHYDLTHGGSINFIDYQRTDGATLDVWEGAFCSDASGCVPPGTDAGDAALGPLAGTFVALDDGGFAIVVDRGASPSWLLVAEGLGAAKTRSLGAAFVEVGG